MQRVLYLKPAGIGKNNKKVAKGRDRTHALIDQGLNMRVLATGVAITSDTIIETNKYLINKTVGP